MLNLIANCSKSSIYNDLAVLPQVINLSKSLFSCTFKYASISEAISSDACDIVIIPYNLTDGFYHNN